MSRHHPTTADTLSAFFQIRPRKDFLPTKGRDRLLSLGLFAQLPQENLDITPPMDIDADRVEHERSAYDFMRKRRDAIGDPNQNRWNAMIRLSNFTSVDSSPLCVSSPPA
jgi:DNA mismatch repair protein MSH5